MPLIKIRTRATKLNEAIWYLYDGCVYIYGTLNFKMTIENLCEFSSHWSCKITCVLQLIHTQNFLNLITSSIQWYMYLLHKMYLWVCDHIHMRPNVDCPCKMTACVRVWMLTSTGEDQWSLLQKTLLKTKIGSISISGSIDLVIEENNDVNETVRGRAILSLIFN